MFLETSEIYPPSKISEKVPFWRQGKDFLRKFLDYSFSRIGSWKNFLKWKISSALPNGGGVGPPARSGEAPPPTLSSRKWKSSLLINHKRMITCYKCYKWVIHHFVIVIFVSLLIMILISVPIYRIWLPESHIPKDFTPNQHFVTQPTLIFILFVNDSFHFAST